MIGWIALDALGSLLYTSKRQRAAEHAEFDENIRSQSKIGFYIVFLVMTVILSFLSVTALLVAFPLGLAITGGSVFVLVKAYVTRKAKELGM